MKLFTNPLVLAALMAMVLAQITKVLLILLTERRWALERMTETGGMPSSHSATVAALCTSCGLYYGVDTPLFAIALVFGVIVVYDATRVRRAAGRHA